MANYMSAMTLSDFLSAKGLKPAAFARTVGLSASTVTRILDGSRRPTLDVALKIVRATDGKVSCEELAAIAHPQKVS